MSNITIISLEGNIGSGKSTLLANLRNYYSDNSSVIFLKEPVDEWEEVKDENGISMLKKFYAEPKAYAFPFQMMAFISRLNVLRETLKTIKNSDPSKKFIIITERSLYTDKMVFAKMLHDSGNIEYINYQIYLKWFDTFSEEFPVNKAVYVKTNPEKCYSRILKRSRDGESNIPLDYLQNCALYHDNMLDEFVSKNICRDQIVLDGNVDIYENESQVEMWVKEIDEFIKR